MSNTPEDILKRIESQKNVMGTIIVNEDGIPVRTTLDNTTTVQYANHMRAIARAADSAVRDLDPQNEMCYVRIRTKKSETIVAPEKDYILIVIQTVNNK